MQAEVFESNANTNIEHVGKWDRSNPAHTPVTTASGFPGCIVPSDRFTEELGCIGELQLFFDPCAIRLDGLDADVQGLCDLARFIT